MIQRNTARQVLKVKDKATQSNNFLKTFLTQPPSRLGSKKSLYILLQEIIKSVK